MKPNGKKSNSWEGLSPEQKSERVRKANATRQARLQQKEKLGLQRGAEINQKALTQFYHRPEWMARFDEDDRKLAAEFLREAIEGKRKEAMNRHEQFILLSKQDRMKEALEVVKNDSSEDRKRFAAHHLLELIDGLYANSISLEDFIKGIRINRRNSIPDFSHISRFN
jgi:hypothetical protein